MSSICDRIGVSRGVICFDEKCEIFDCERSIGTIVGLVSDEA